MQMNKDGNTSGVSLYVTLSPQDAELLRAAVPADIAPRDTLGMKETSTLAQMALGAVCRAILRQRLPTAATERRNALGRPGRRSGPAAWRHQGAARMKGIV
jgi:hypothetical protein